MASSVASPAQVSEVALECWAAPNAIVLLFGMLLECSLRLEPQLTAAVVVGSH